MAPYLSLILNKLNRYTPSWQRTDADVLKFEVTPCHAYDFVRRINLAEPILKSLIQSLSVAALLKISPFNSITITKLKTIR